MLTEASPRRRAAFVATLALAMGIGPFAVTAVGALSPVVVPELGLSRAELGSLATVTFAVAAAASILGGRQVDAFPARVVMVALFVTGGAAAVVAAGAASLAWLWAAAALGGLTQAAANPVTNQLVSEHAPAGRQGLQVGVKQSGVPMIQAVVGFVLPPLAVVVGWRGAVLTGVTLALLGVVAVRLAVPGAGAARSATEHGDRVRLPPGVWWLAGYTFVMSMTVMAVIIFAPLYAFERVGLSPAVAGMSTGVLGVAGIAARIGWTRVAERRAAPDRLLTALAAIACAAVALLAAGERLGPMALWAGLVGFGGSAVAVNAVVMLTVVRQAARGRTGTASGVVGLGLYGGFMTGPLLVGPLVDRTESYLLGWTVVAGLCLVAVAVCLVWRRLTPPVGSAGSSS